VIVAMTYDAADRMANDFIARLASTVYASVIAAPASARYRAPQGVQYVEIGRALTLDVTVDNIGDDPWTIGGPGRIGLSWELRDAANSLIARGPRPLPLGQVEAMAYDAVGNMTSRKDFTGKTTTFEYDTNNRLLKRTPDASFAGESAVSFAYSATGRRLTMADGTGTTKYTLDSRDRLLSKAAPAGTLTVVLGPGWPGILLHEAVGHGLEGDFNRKGVSAFSGRIGERVASPLVTVVDDGTLPSRRGPPNVDD
jgi:YD repeat-containing protein